MLISAKRIWWLNSNNDNVVNEKSSLSGHPCYVGDFL